ncbi:mycofactocin biosynthesis chaperone MftB [Kribbella sp. NPDC050124]|uniref:mycofactocin biosynthesis chaperone MftB n=1 Tax=Kribbella sp. NPDC050124 TaxID=3364114 RepID=UPI0037BBD3C0
MNPRVEVRLDQGLRLSPSVSLRPEPFGALAYHFGNRRLTFLKRRELLDVVLALSDQPDVRSALVVAGLPESQWPAYLAALQGLADTEMLRPSSVEEVPV